MGEYTPAPQARGGMHKDKLIAELCDFGLVYSLYTGRKGISVKASWELPSGQTCSVVFAVDLENDRIVPLGRKNNQAPPEQFDGKKICAWVRAELDDIH